jgi:FlaA1/EpsC-like NDP-sugar epimerase
LFHTQQTLAKLHAVVRHWARTGPPHSRLWIHGINTVLFICSGLLAFFIRFEFKIPREHWTHALYAVCTWVVVKSAAAYFYRTDRGWWRFVSVIDVVRIFSANLTASVISAIWLSLAAPPGFPRSTWFLDFTFCLLATCGVRIAARIFIESPGAKRSADAKKVFLYGAGHGGMMLLRELRSGVPIEYDVRGFIDDAENKRGHDLQGVPVLGPGKHLPALANECSAEEVLIAIPSASGEQMTRILSHCRAAGLRSRTVPSLTEVIQNRHHASQLREIVIEDLLGRGPVKLDETEIGNCVQGKVILVTGAGGSIGSEICRQLARFGAGTIVGVDVAETALFHLDREMTSAFPDVRFRPELGNVQSQTRIDELLQEYSPETIYHAAAYKHVPMAELHLFEAVENNILGTYNVAAAAERNGVKRFVMISTDKAVRPTNLMGATKRVAELTVRSLQGRTTKYVSVRFGNVLGSNGSVVPIFLKQIAAGGPVTVTHPNMKRFFMTIPEAVQLVLQAASFGKGGEIFVLDMGEQVKIVDLAHKLILLSGLRPNVDIPITFTNPRAGEKLYEELSLLSEDLRPTHHEKIRIFDGPVLSVDQVTTHIELLKTMCRYRMGDELISAIRSIVPEYTPSAEIRKRYRKASDAVGVSEPSTLLNDLYSLHFATDHSE